METPTSTTPSHPHNSIAIIGGAGAVGSTCAYALMLQNIVQEIIVVDVDVPKMEGQVLDLQDTRGFTRTSSVRGGTIADARNSRIIVITAGIAQRPGQTRIELVEKNKNLLNSIVGSLKPIHPQSILLLVANPVDILTYHAQQISGLPRNQVIGSGTLLDTQRLRGILAHKLNVALTSIHAHILGEHGDSQLAAWSSAQISGTPLRKFMPELTDQDLSDIAKETREKAQKIIEKKGATFYGIAGCVSEICTDVVYNRRRVLPLSTYIPEWDVCLSVPVVLGEHGIERTIPLNLSEEESQYLKKSADRLREVLKQ